MREASALPKTRNQLHLIPRSRGGLHMIGNKVLACMECNSKKDNMTAFEFVVHMIGTSPL